MRAGDGDLADTSPADGRERFLRRRTPTLRWALFRARHPDLRPGERHLRRVPRRHGLRRTHGVLRYREQHLRGAAWPTRIAQTSSRQPVSPTRVRRAQTTRTAHGLRGRRWCETTSARCVECTPATEATDCGAKSCHPSNFVCTLNDRGSLDFCDACASDTECMPDHLCVPTFAGANPVGNRCLRRASAGCQRPATRIAERTSTLGVTADVCTLYEAGFVTCAGVELALDNMRCVSPGLCGGLIGTRCEPCDRHRVPWPHGAVTAARRKTTAHRLWRAPRGSAEGTARSRDRTAHSQRFAEARRF